MAGLLIDLGFERGLPGEDILSMSLKLSSSARLGFLELP